MKQMPNPKFELAATVVLFVLVSLAAWAALAWPLRTKLFPLVLLLPVLVLILAQALWNVVTMVQVSKGVQRPEEEGEENENDFFASVWADREAQRRVIVLLTWILAFVVAILLLGFTVGTSLLTVAYLRVSRTSWVQCFIIGLGNYLALRVGFESALEMPLNAGVIAGYLGISRVDDLLIAPFMLLVLGQ